MPSLLSLPMHRRNIHVFIACLLAFSLIMMPFIPLASAASRRAARQPINADSKKADMAGKREGHNAFPAPVPAPAPVPFAVAITATKTDAIISDDGDGKADPGGTEKIEYTVTISNNGTTDATDVMFNDTIDAHTTLVGGSVNTQPIADPDTYSASGNIAISQAAPGVLANDRDPDTGNNSGLTVTAVQGAGANVGVATDTTAVGRGGVKGSVTLNSDGSFTYEPPPGFVGADTFTYTASDGTLTDTATVTINISGMVWFIQNNAGGLNRGTFSNPFTTIAAFNTANAASGVAPDPKNGDFIALRTGTGTYSETDGVNLRSQQKLIGNGVAFNTAFTADANSIAAYTTFASAAGSAPNIVTSAGNGVDLSTDNTVRGLNVGNTPGFFKINGTAVGSPIINTVNLTGTGGALNVATSGAFGSNVTFGTFESTSSPAANLNLVGVTGTLGIASPGSGLSGSNAASAAVNVSGGSVSFTYSGNVSKTNAGSLVSISGGHSTGTILFQTGTLSASTGDGLQFNNADGIYNFNGTNTLSGGDAGIDILNGSSGAFTFSASTTITSPSGSAFNVGSAPGNPTVTYSGSITQNTSGQRVVNIDGTTGSTITFQTGSITGGASSTGININNANGNVTFSNGMTLGTSGSRMTNQALTITNGGSTATYGLGSVSIFTTGAQGIVATNFDGTLNATGTVDTTAGAPGATAAAINIDGPVGLTTLGLNFTKVSANNSTNGIVVQDTNGSFTITGTSTTDGTGGTISNITNRGASFINATTISLSNMTFTNAGTANGADPTLSGSTCGDLTVGGNTGCNAAIHLQSTTGVTLTNVDISGGNQEGINGNNVTNFTLTNSTVTNVGDQVREDGLRFLNMLGTSSITNSTFTNNEAVQIHVENNTGPIGTSISLDNLSVQSTGLAAAPNGSHGFLYFGQGSSNADLTIQNSTFNNLFSNSIHTDSNSSGTTEVTINNNVFTNVGASGITMAQDGSGPFRFNIHDNGTALSPTFLRGTNTGSSHSINVNQAGNAPQSAVMEGQIVNNFIGDNSSTTSANSAGDGIRVLSVAPGTVNVLISGNTVRNPGSNGINVQMSEDTNVNHKVNATVLNNNATVSDVNSFDGIRMVAGALSGDAGTMCLDLVNNDGSATAGGNDFTVRQRFVTTMQLRGYTGANNSDASVQTFLDVTKMNDPLGAGNDWFITNNVAGGGGGFVNTPGPGNACTQPTLPSVSMNSSPSQQHIFAQRKTAEPNDNNGAIATATSSVTEASVEASRPSLLARALTAIADFAGAVHSLVEPTAYASSDTSRSDYISPVVDSGNRATEVSTTYQPADNSGRKASSKTQNRTVMNHARMRRTLPLMFSGESVSINIGTLRAGDSVTIKFQVTVDSPPNLSLLNPPRVTNQGTVSGSNFTSVLTDDPDAVGAADSTDTPVDLFDTSTTLVSDLNPSNFGEQVTFTATVAETPTQASADPTGTVDFIDTSNGDAVICNDVALSGGSAQCQTSSLTAGTHNIRADYSGDGNFDSSQSNVVAQVVNACTPNPVVTSTADDGAGTLRDALANVCSGDTITFDLAGDGPHTITLTTGELAVTRNVTIKNASGESITVSGNNASRVFNINSGKTASIIGLNITGGNATGDGGAILNDGALTVVNSALFGNTATGVGGGISTSATSTSLTLINTTVSGNSAAGSGGGVIVLGGTMTSINSTITNNTADSDNNSVGTGGGIRANAGTTTLKNTIVAGNVNENGATDAADDISGTVDPLSSFNLIGIGGGGGLMNGLNNNQVGVASPGLGSLGNNGGITQTHALLPTSPAVEAGSNANLPADSFDLDGDANTGETLPVDQRGPGFPRVADSADVDTTPTVDIGAFELHPTIENIADQTTAEDTAKMVTFNLGDDTGSLISTVTATSSNTALVASDNAHLSFSGSGGSRTLTITPNTNANSPADGTTTITVTVTATNGQTASDTFVLTVTEVNDNPDAVNDTLTAIDEDSGTRIIPFADLLANDTAGPANESGQTITITAVSNPVGGTVQINGTNVEFTPTANFFGSASFDYTITDNGTTNGVLDAKSDTATASFTVNAINDPPSFTIAADPPASNEDAGPQTVLNFATNISAGPGETGQTLTFNLTPTGSTGTLTFSSGPAIDATTGTLTYTASPDTNGTATFSVTLSDDGSNTPPNSNTSAPQSFTITVNAQNDAPVVTTTAGNLSYTENDPPTAIDPGLTVTDIDSTDLVGATVAITAGFASSQDTLGFTNQLGITGNYNSGTGVLTLSGTTTVANYQTALRSVTYQNSSDNPTASRTVTFTADDGTSTGSATRGITISAVNDPPVNTVPGPQGTNQNTPLVFSSGNGNQISVSDPDAGTNTIQVTLSATNGTLTLSGTSGLSFSFSDGNGTGAGDGTNDATMTFRGTIANINTALNGMFFTPTAGFSGAASLTIMSNDLGNTGSGGPLTDTDVVNIQVSTNISIQDAQVVEPSSGSVNMIFTVTLSAPAPASGVSVNFTTQDETPPSLTHATAGQDYTTTSGTLNFASGEQFKTILVPVLADNVGESNETFLVVLSNPVNGTIADGTATGTILVADQAGTILIKELRTSGPAGAGDDFVEIYNNSSTPHTVAATDGSGGYGLFKMGADCNATPVLIGVIPNGTVIAARGHYLFTGSVYSLANYGGTGAAAGDQTLSQDIENDRNVAIFSTASLTGISSANRLDAVGFGGNTGGICDLLREGTTLTPLSGSVLEYSYFRDECGKKGNPATFGPCPTGGFVKDSNVNGDDFIFVDTTATLTPAGQRLGAPGPENLSSPRVNLSIAALLLDSTQGAPAPPNRVRDFTPQLPNAMNGTLSIRRRYVNNTGANVTRLRFRIVDITALSMLGGIADLRALSSMSITVNGINDSATCAATGTPSTPPCSVTVYGTTLETPPAQPLGGAFNSSLSAGTITLPQPLAPGQSVNLQMLLGVQQTGAFKLFFNIEALP